MRLFRVVALTIAPLVVGAPCVSLAGGFGVGHGQSLRGPSGSTSTFPMSPRRDRGFDRNPFAGKAVVPWYPYGGTAYESVPYAVVPAGPAEIPASVIVAPPPEPPVADPKFVFPPTPSGPEPASTHTVIVQRGSKIEVQSFPAAR